MELIKETIVGIIQDLTNKRGSIGSTPQGLLGKVLTTREKRHIKFSYYKKGVLGLSVDSSSWLYSFTLKKDDLKQKLNKGSCTVKDIRLRLGEM